MSDWSIDERRAYAIGIEKGRDLARKEQGQPGQVPTMRDRFAMAALAAGSDKLTAEGAAIRAYRIADAMFRARSQFNDEIPF